MMSLDPLTFAHRTDTNIRNAGKIGLSVTPHKPINRYSMYEGVLIIP